MTDVPKPDSPDHGDRPGKIRTMWHPLLVRMLDYTLGAAYSVREEVSVGKMPLRVDILLIRRETGQVSPAHAEEISVLLPLLNRFTLIEFKGPTDVLERGDFSQLLGCSFLWYSQENETIPHEEVSLIVVAPRINKAFRDELQQLGLGASQQEPGIFQVSGLPFVIRLVETDVMAERGEPVLSLVSRVFYNDGRRIIKGLGRAGYGRLAGYAAQQIGRYHRGEDFDMIADSEKIAELDDEVLAEILQWAPVEKRLHGIPLEERLRGLSPTDVLRMLPPDDLAAVLGSEQAARIREILDEKKRDSTHN